MFPANVTAQPMLALHRAVVNPESTMMGLTPGGAAAGVPFLQMGNISASGNDLTAAWNTLDTGTVNGSGIDAPISAATPSGDTIAVYGGLCQATTVLNNVAQFIVTLSFYDATQATGISTYSYSGAWYGGNATMSQTNLPVPFGTFPPLPITVSTTALIDYSGATRDPHTNMPPPYNLAYADVTLTLITDEGATLLANHPATYLIASNGGSSMGPWTQFLLQYGRTFTERVYFQNTPQ
jgi:hypothetical protein